MSTLGTSLPCSLRRQTLTNQSDGLRPIRQGRHPQPRLLRRRGLLLRLHRMPPPLLDRSLSNGRRSLKTKSPPSPRLTPTATTPCRMVSSLAVISSSPSVLMTGVYTGRRCVSTTVFHAYIPGSNAPPTGQGRRRRRPSCLLHHRRPPPRDHPDYQRRHRRREPGRLHQPAPVRAECMCAR